MDRIPRTAAIWTATGAALAAALVVATGLANAGGSAPGDAGGGPTEIALPNGFQPEGVAIGAEPVAFFGSLANGAIFRVDLATGQGAVIGQPPGTPSVGMKVDAAGRLFVAGGRAGDARVVDTASGAVLASYELVAEGFVNDVVLTSAGAFFTDSTNPVVYHLPVGAGGELPAPDEVVRIPLIGEIEYAEGINANGIALAPDGETLLIVQTNTGLLFTLDAATGETARTGVVDVAGDGLLPNGDGLLVVGQTLFVVQNRLNTLAVLEINNAGSQADLVDRLSDERFDVPTTVAAFEDLLYLPNARFGIEATPETEYNAVAIARP